MRERGWGVMGVWGGFCCSAPQYGRGRGTMAENGKIGPKMGQKWPFSHYSAIFSPFFAGGAIHFSAIFSLAFRAGLYSTIGIAMREDNKNSIKFADFPKSHCCGISQEQGHICTISSSPQSSTPHRERKSLFCCRLALSLPLKN